MNFKFTKDNWIFSVSSILGAIIFCSLVFVAYAEVSNQVAENKRSPATTIIIDAGHGGEDGGAVGIDGVVEKDINLAISLKLMNLLEASGHKVIMTREKDQAIYDEGSSTLREKKRSDLRNRMGIIKNSKKNNAIFVSIHQNKFPNPKYFGTQIFYSVNDPKSQDLAEKIKESVVGLIQPENTREIKPADKKIYLLHNADIPAVIVECGFLSNSEESKKLVDEKYQSQVAFSIYCGITSYIMNNSETES